MERFSMIAIRQIHEHLAEVIEVPPELRNRKTEVIFLAIEEASVDHSAGEQGRSDSGVHAPSPSVFFGALPDLPAREVQGKVDSRQELP
jgi:hypothetical protein